MDTPNTAAADGNEAQRVDSDQDTEQVTDLASVPDTADNLPPSASATAAPEAIDDAQPETGDEPVAALIPDDSFATLQLAPAIARAVAELGYETATAVQLRCIPPLLEGRDVLGQAQTGTGKTAAFALPLLSRLDPQDNLPQVLVLTPTRELALQVAEAFQRYAHHLPGFHVAPVYGGQSYGLQVRQLQRGPQVVVGTPGRIMDHMRRGTLSLERLKALVLDEADEMLNMGFAEDIDWIFEHTPAERQVALFSATMPAGILKVAREHLIDPVEVRIESATATVDTIEQQHVVVTRFHKADVLTRILELEDFDGMLIFVRTKGGTTELVDKLRSQGFAAEALNGDMNQEMRERTVERLKGGQLDILVATDVAARGLDVERISHVINFDIPTDPSAYVHRIGRTGRAGRTGKAILLVEPRERGLLRSIERIIRRPIPEMAAPSAEQLSASRIDRFTTQLRETLAEQDLDFFYRLIARVAKEQELELMDIAAAASYLIQRERPLDVKEPPRRARQDAREGGYERPRREGYGRDERPPRRGEDRGRSQRPPRGDRDSGPPYAGRPERPGFDRDRSAQWGDRSFEEERDRQPTQVPYQGVRAPHPTEHAFQRDRGGPGERPRFDRERGPAWQERGFRPDRDAQPPFRDQGPPPFHDREDSRDDDRGNRDPRFARDRYQDRGNGPRPDFRGEPRSADRPPRDRGGRGGVDLVQHRIEVGHRDGVTPREIVGAIANESGLEGRFIGHIDIRDDHAVVDLPSGMPREVFQHLKHVYVCGKELQISVMEGSPRPGRPPRDDRDGDPRPPRRRDAAGPPAPRGQRPNPGFRKKPRD
jgi:ATP-dependent RNA helicase DeaD